MKKTKFFEFAKTCKNCGEVGKDMVIEASKLALTDKFMQYEPITEKEENLKTLLIQGINAGFKDFCIPNLDPTFTSDGEGICYVPGKNPAVGKSYKWWLDACKKYMPARNSRLGTMWDYVAFLGVFIKTLVLAGLETGVAWYVVCSDSRELGHYWNADSVHRKFKPTGSESICGFFDLVNTCKILAVTDNMFALNARGCLDYNFNHSISELEHYYDPNYDCKHSVGWTVYDA